MGSFSEPSNTIAKIRYNPDCELMREQELEMQCPYYGNCASDYKQCAMFKYWQGDQEMITLAHQLKRLGADLNLY
jgi:hypothetical protein